jgi:hypothetical protein
MSAVTTLSSAAILANPDLLIPEQRAGRMIYLDDLDRTVAPDLSLIKQLVAEEQEKAAEWVMEDDHDLLRALAKE